jgi:hypothetical protein
MMRALLDRCKTILITYIALLALALLALSLYGV